MPGLEDVHVLGILLCLDNCKYIFRTAFDVNPIASQRTTRDTFACLVFVDTKSNEGLSALLQIAVLKASCHHEVDFFVDQTIVGRRGPRSMCHHRAASELPLRLEATNSSSVLCSAAAISIAADLVLLGILQARSAYSTFLLKASMDHFHLTTRKAACIERVCCEDDCYDIDTFNDVDSVA
jgi:hypothetical protein